MPSKSRGGLSKREYAAKQSGKAMPYAGTSKSSKSTQSSAMSSTDINPSQLGGSFKFDPNKYVPTFQAEASAIYDPQIANLNAIRSLNQSSYQQDTIVNREQLANRLKSEVESINRRGAFFSGGALTRETNVRTDFDRALLDMGTTYQQKDLGIQSELGQLGTAKSQYVRDMLNNAQSGAYSQWKDQRDFLYQLLSGNRTARMSAESEAFDRNYKLASLKKSGSGSGSGSDIRSKYVQALQVLVDPNTGYADARKIRQLADEYFAETGKQLDVSGYLAPNDPMRGAILTNRAFTTSNEPTP